MVWPPPLVFHYYIGQAFRGLPPGWRLSLLSSHTEFERTFGRTADKKRKLYNGMIKCDLFQYNKR